MREKQANLAFGPVFLKKIVCHLRPVVFNKKLYGKCKSNINLVNPFVCEPSEPDHPSDQFFLTKFVFRVKLKRKFGEHNPFCEGSEPNCPLENFMTYGSQIR